MEIVYLGLLSSIFNWVFSKILSPVFSFLSSLLEKVLGWLFNSVLSPLLQEVLWPIFTGLLDLVISVLAGVLYTVFAALLKIVSALEASFNIFAGLAEVTYQAANDKKTCSLLELVFQMKSIRTAFLCITLMGVLLTVVFSAIAVSRNIFEMDTDNTRPVSKILGMTLRAMGKFIIVPVMAIFLIRLSSVVLAGIAVAVGGSNSSLARTVFVVASLDAAINEQYNISTNTDKKIEIGIDDSVRGHFYRGETGYDCFDKNSVKKYFNFAKFDYLIGYAACIFFIVVLAICLLNFVSRIFEVMVLYIISPLFVAVMPLDDGEKFKAWQDMFIAKIFSGFGSVMAMRLYMMLAPIVMGGSISFGKGTVEADYLIKLIFLLGGGWSVLKSGPLITQMLNFQAGRAEQEKGGFVTMAAMDVGSGIKMRGKEAAGWLGQKIKGASAEGAGALAGGNGMSGGGPNGGAGAFRGTASSGQKFDKVAASGGRVGKGPTKAFLNGHFRTETDADGKERLGVHFGKVLSVGQDSQNRFEVKFLGMGVRMGGDGKVDKVSAPFLRFKRDSEGEMRISKVKVGMGSRDSWLGKSILGGLRWKRAENVVRQPDGTYKREMGGMYFSDLSAGPLGVKRRYDQDTGKAETLQLGGHFYEKENGEYKKAYSSYFGFDQTYGHHEDGSEYVMSRDYRPLHLHMKYDVVPGQNKTQLSGVYTTSGFNIFRRVPGSASWGSARPSGDSPTPPAEGSNPPPVTPVEGNSPTPPVTPVEGNSPTPPVTPAEGNNPVPPVTPAEGNNPAPPVTPVENNNPPPAPAVGSSRPAEVSAPSDSGQRAGGDGQEEMSGEGVGNENNS